jgi:hypothetical protein
MINTLDPRSISKATFHPHLYLTNLALAYFQATRGFISTQVFPMVPVRLSIDRFYEFDKGDLARDNITPKPEYGHVTPFDMGKREQTYKCMVDQGIIAIDEISTLDWSRSGAPAIIDPRQAKTRVLAEQMAIHRDRVWANKYFNSESWTQVYTGVAATPTGNQFYYFDNENFDPVRFFAKLSTDMLKSGIRKPNKMVMGALAFNALRNNPAILERIKYQGSAATPADINANVLAQLFGLDQVLVSEAIWNSAPLGATDSFNFICNPNDCLLVYTTNAPSIEEPSAGYTFTWDMLGNGQYLAVQQYEGADRADHTQYIEGLIAMDPEVTAPDLGVYLSGCVTPAT